jgi:phosphatidylserine/phosphatidylglycerophosphate/cardiolipin synthase-like enzyme
VMGTSDKERARAYRQRQAERQAKLRERGVLQIKVMTAGPASAGIERISQATADIYLQQPDEITDEMLNELHEDLLASFLSSGAPQMVEFKIDGHGAVGVKMIP